MDCWVGRLVRDSRFESTIHVNLYDEISEWAAHERCCGKADWCFTYKNVHGSGDWRNQLSTSFSISLSELDKFGKLMRVSKNLNSIYVHVSGKQHGQDGIKCSSQHVSCLFVRDLIYNSRGANINLSFSNVAHTDCIKNMFSTPDSGLIGASLARQSSSPPLALNFSFEKANSSPTAEMLAIFFSQLVGTGHVVTLEFPTYFDLEASLATFRTTFCNALSSNQCVLQRLSVYMSGEEDVESGLLDALAHAFATDRCSIKHLRICHLSATQVSLAAFFESLRVHRNSLETLEIVENECFFQETIDGTAACIFASHCRLQVLNFDDTPSEFSASPRYNVASLCRALATNETVTRLSLRGARSGKAGAVALCNMLLENKSLRVVDFSKNPCFYKKTQLTALQMPFCVMASKNTTLQRLYLCETLSNRHLNMLMNTVAQENFTLTHLSCCSGHPDDRCCFHDKDVPDDGEWDAKSLFPDAPMRRCLHRNRSIIWQKSLHDKIVDFCMALGPLQLPPYVLLEIFDWLPWMDHVRHWNKIQLIVGLHHSRRRILQAKAQR